jgi:hypothetical protein
VRSRKGGRGEGAAADDVDKEEEEEEETAAGARCARPRGGGEKPARCCILDEVFLQPRWRGAHDCSRAKAEK